MFWENNKTHYSRQLCKKTASLEKLKDYVRYLLPKVDYMLQWHQKKRIRNLKFKRYIYAQKAINELCKSFEDKTVGFGDWSNTDNGGFIKKSPAGPVKRLESRMKYYCKVISIDEFRSSKLHTLCHSETKNAYCHKKCKKCCA